MSEHGRRCARCGTLYPPHLIESAFRLDTSRRKNWSGRKWTCRPCEQTSRDERKLANRWKVKARDVIRRHAIRLGFAKDDLVKIYGWDPERLAHDAEYQYGNGCNYCGHAYQSMGHGLSDISLDIMDRSKSPYYRTNTKWCCQTCNRKKGDKGPTWFESDRQVYEAWMQNNRLPAADRGFLF